MKIYIIDNSPDKLKYAELFFYGCDDVECVCLDFDVFMHNYDVDCVVSPANAFGVMDGGYDEAIIAYFGQQLQDRVQQYIVDHFYGEQPVGTSFIIDSGRSGCTLIHTPTVRTPQDINEPLVVYQCMRTTLMCAIENNVESILIPLFGGGYGYLHPKLIAELMWNAYEQIKKPPSMIDRAYMEEHDIVIDETGIFRM